MKAAGTGVGMGDLHRKECVTRLGFYGFGSFFFLFFPSQHPPDDQRRFSLLCALLLFWIFPPLFCFAGSVSLHSFRSHQALG